MGDINYLGSVVKILEKPKQRVLNDKIVITEFRAQLAQVNNTRIINLTFWGNLARDIVNYYHINDYIMIEGYISLHDKKNNNMVKSKLKRAEITVFKIYPIKN